MSGAAARRAAIAAALAEHVLDASAPHARDAEFVDGFVALSVAADQSGLDAATLAIAAAEGDDTSAMIARVLLAERAYRAASSSEEVVAVDAWLESVCGLLDVAATDDDEALVRWLASPAVGLDVAQIRRAQIASAGATLRDSLAQSLNSFRGLQARERAMHAARALRLITGALGRPSATLAKIARAAVDAAALLAPKLQDAHGDAFVLAATAADAVWESFGRPLPASDRVRLFCDALRRTDSRAAAWPVSRLAFLPEDNLRDRNLDALLLKRRAIARRPYELHEDLEDPWVWPPPDPARVIVAPPMTFSASRLNAFVKCGRRWFYDYLCDAVDDVGSIHATYGKVVHEALEALHRDVRLPGDADPAAVLDRFLSELNTAFGKSRSDFASQFEYEVSRLQARRVAPRYVDWLVKQATVSPMEIVEVESVNRLREGGHDFVGYIDRVDRPRDGGPVTIFDYKTGRVPDNPKAYLDDVRAGDEAQLALYYFMRRARGDEVATIALISVRNARDDVSVLALDIVEDGAEKPKARAGAVACPRSVLDASLAALVRRCDLLTRDGLSHFSVGEDPPCRFCAYFSACRERPPEPERTFAR